VRVFEAESVTPHENRVWLLASKLNEVFVVSVVPVMVNKSVIVVPRPRGAREGSGVGPIDRRPRACLMVVGVSWFFEDGSTGCW